GQEIPKLYTCDDKNASPPLAWTEPPAGTKTFAIMMNDPDAPSAEKTGNPFVHWILINVPADTRSVVEGIRRLHIPPGAKEGTNDMKHEGYDGPCPPSGATHR